MSIVNFLQIIKDKRDNRGKRYNLLPILSLLLGGLLQGYNNLASIHRWSKTLSKAELIELGFIKGKVCCYSNFTIILRKVDPDDISRIMHKLSSDSSFRQILHIDGKFLKKSNSFGDKEQSQIMTIFNGIKGATIGNDVVKNRDEISSMLRLLKKCDIRGSLITADALFARQHILEEIVNQGADFAISLKGNEANLKHYTERLFNESSRDNLETRSFTEEINCEHGRIEQRSIEVLDMPWEFLNGHRHIKQLCKITRFREQKNRPSSTNEEVAYMVTSLGKEYPPKQLLRINRSHWSCENNLNWVKDNVFLEDKSTISKGIAPIVMSLFRSLAIQIIRTISSKITQTREIFNQNNHLIWKKFASISCDF